ncbi:hypothetical protein AMTRI_Chr12g235290 [Amborella trichopoda]|uniref:Uncharacterized protein n=2 Tax=Amborella trichopoda TaxID=13333 RepID=W1P9H2_AMBTC|nr:uncharacterized protein LOC18431794 isoform X2 [Amborella trichopoda]ERN03635.1 hypothetical protein AMTR_s00144p00020950 [Amborella trichopoda]|eukprot:XP_006841960.1 uncharacterized protein LOC18431794 isoform X2 [Amborella trichopoda]
MERFLENYNKENLKKAMLKHEEIFKEQVSELHRLYRVQKLLMDDLRSKSFQHQPSTDTSAFILSGVSSTKTHGQCFWRTKFENDQNLNTTNHHSNDVHTLQRKFDLESPADEDMGEALLRIESENDIELTLSIGFRKEKKEVHNRLPSSAKDRSSNMMDGRQGNNFGEKLMDHHLWGAGLRHEMGETCKSERKAFNPEERHRQDVIKQHPPWLFQVK